MTMRSTAPLIVAIGCVMSAAFGDDRPSKMPASAQYDALLLTIRKAQALTASHEPADSVKAIDLLGGIHLDAGNVGHDVGTVLKSRLQYQSGQAATAQGDFLHVLGSRSASPEVLLGLLELNKDVFSVATAIRKNMARVLPLSVWAMQANAEGNGIRAFINPGRPNIPAVNMKVYIAIAEAFDRGGFHSEAWMSFVESAYAGAPSWIHEGPRSEAWFSADTAYLWRSAAVNAWKAGERSLAVDYLTKFGVFGSEAQFEEAKEIYEKWTNGEDQAAEPPPSRDEKRRALEEVLRLYAEMNAHPRCFAIIQAHREFLDNPDELFAKYLEQWKAVLKSYSQEAEGVVYGVKLTPDLDPTTIKIPWACSPEAAKEAHAKVTKLLGDTK